MENMINNNDNSLAPIIMTTKTPRNETTTQQNVKHPLYTINVAWTKGDSD